MKISILVVIILVLASYNQEKKTEFSLTGTTNELKNGTVLYLLDSSMETIIDSTTVQNNRFNLTTNLPTHPFLAVLKNKDNSLYKRLWLDNKPMFFDASKQDFENAVISGSESETLYNNYQKALETLTRTEKEKLQMDFIRTNADNMMGAYVLSIRYISWKKEKTEPLYNQLSKKNKNSFYGKKILKYIELNQNPTIGEHYVDFQLTDQNGNKIMLSDQKGKLVLLEFWASGCRPCRKDNKYLVEYYNKFNSLGFEIFQVSLDSEKQEWINAIKKDSLQWTNASDLNGWNNEAAVIYGINLLPTNFLINENGIIINKDLRGQELERKIIEILE